MKLYPPFQISARLMPGLQVANAWISLAIGEQTRAGRYRYQV